MENSRLRAELARVTMQKSEDVHWADPDWRISGDEFTFSSPLIQIFKSTTEIDSRLIGGA